MVHGRGGAPPRSAGRSGRLRGGFRERKWRRRRAGEMARGRGGLFAAGSVWATGTGRCWLKAGILSGNWVEPCGEAAGGTSEVALRGRVRAGGGKHRQRPNLPGFSPLGRLSAAVSGVSGETAGGFCGTPGLRGVHREESEPAWPGIPRAVPYCTIIKLSVFKTQP